MLGEHPAGGRDLLLGQAELVADDVEDPGPAGVHRPAGDVLGAQPGPGEQLVDDAADVPGQHVGHPRGEPHAEARGR